MYSYSPVKKINIKNFRNLGSVELDFEQSPIISLIGDNESGKTSVVKAFSVCAINSDYRSQKDFIRDGTTGFGVALELQDGTTITRIKMTNGNRYTVKFPDGKVWDATKVESDVPAAVQQVMGLIEEPETGEYLHIRTYEDKLLFVVTPASTNYKVMYNALKISQITSAIREGAAEANGLRGDIADGEASVNTLVQSMASIKTHDIEPLINVRDKMLKVKETLAKLEKAESLRQTIQSLEVSLGAMNEIEKAGLKPLDVNECQRLNDIGRILSEIEQLKTSNSLYIDLDDASSIDISTIERLTDAVTRKGEMQGLVERSGALVELSDVNPISETVVSSLIRCGELLDSINVGTKRLEIYTSEEPQPISDSTLTSLEKLSKALKLQSDISENSKKLDEITKYTDGVIEWMKAVGVATTSCPKCGEAVIIDIDQFS